MISMTLIGAAIGAAIFFLILLVRPRVPLAGNYAPDPLTGARR